MIAPLLALPLAVQLVAISDSVPRLNVNPSCKGAADAGYIARTEDRLKTCLESEERTRNDLVKNWSTFPAADRTYCLSSIRGFAPTYTELATCLEMKRDARKIATEPQPELDAPAATSGSGTVQPRRRQPTPR
jgi:hypothetical protein